MSERKVLNKYYPPDYDPSKVPRVKRKNKQNDVRTMAPFNMRCSTCGNYIAAGTKFNAKKETVENETYNKLLIFRFYIKCPRCMTSIIFRTDLKEHSYVVEHGATENHRALKLAEQKARDDAEAEEEEAKIDPMKQLENRTKASKKQMESSEQIQQLRSIKHKQHSVDIDSLIREKRLELSQEARPAIAAPGVEVEVDEIREEAKRLYREKSTMSFGEIHKSIKGPEASCSRASSSGIGPSAKRSSSSSVLSNLKKKIKVLPKSVSSKDDVT